MELAINRKARFDYSFEEKLQAGIELTGHEVKSAKKGYMNLTASYVIFNNKGEAFLFGAQIASFQAGNAPKDYDIQRTRRLLLTKRELGYLFGKKQEGYSIVPLRVYVNRTLLKIEIAVARGLKKHDKRAKIKERESRREIKQKMNE